MPKRKKPISAEQKHAEALVRKRFAKLEKSGGRIPSENVTFRDQIAANFTKYYKRYDAIAMGLRKPKHPDEERALRWLLDKVIPPAPVMLEMKDVDEFDPEYILSKGDIEVLNQTARKLPPLLTAQPK